MAVQFDVCHSRTKTRQRKRVIYTWTENEAPRGSNEVCSALIDFLSVLEEKIQDGPERPNKLRLFSDACSGQNKNRTIVSSLLHYANTNQTFSSVQHFFPIRGHSYMPPDRVFGRMEQVFRKKEKIETPEEYRSIFSDYGTVKVLGVDWHVKDFKSCSSKALKRKLPFKMRDQRVFVYSKNKNYKLGAKNTYTGDHSLFEVKSKMFNSSYSEIQILPMKNCISKEKQQDVLKLLKYLSESHEVRQFYDKTLMNPEGNTDNVERVYDENEPFL